MPIQCDWYCCSSWVCVYAFYICTYSFAFHVYIYCSVLLLAVVRVVFLRRCSTRVYVCCVFFCFWSIGISFTVVCQISFRLPINVLRKSEYVIFFLFPFPLPRFLDLLSVRFSTKFNVFGYNFFVIYSISGTGNSSIRYSFDLLNFLFNHLQQLGKFAMRKFSQPKCLNLYIPYQRFKISSTPKNV